MKWRRNLRALPKKQVSKSSSSSTRSKKRKTGEVSSIKDAKKNVILR